MKLAEITFLLALLVTETVAVVFPVGVPPLVPVPPVPLLFPLLAGVPALPHPAVARINAIAAMAQAGAKIRRRCRPAANNPPSSMVAIPATGIQCRGRTGPLNVGEAALAAVVLTVSVTLAEVVEPPNVSEETAEPFCENAQDAPDGKPLHAKLSIVPLKPLFAVRVRVAVPDCPAAGTVTVAGEAAIERYGMLLARFCTLSDPSPVVMSYPVPAV